MLCEKKCFPNSKRARMRGFNPYSNGICSASQEVLGLLRKVSQVLILILMEYALRGDVLKLTKSEPRES